MATLDEGLEFTLHKSSSEFNLYDISTVHVDENCSFSALIHTDGDLSFLSTKDCVILRRVLKQKSFHWLDSKAVGLGHHSFFIINPEGHLGIYQLQRCIISTTTSPYTVKCRLQNHAHTLKSILQQAKLGTFEPKDLTILGSCGNTAVLLLGNDVILMQLYADKPVEIERTFTLRDKDVELTRKYGDCVLQLNSMTRQIDVYNIHQGKQIAVIELNSLLQHSKIPQHVQKVHDLHVSTDQQSLYVVLEENCLICIDLDQYFLVHPEAFCEDDHEGDDMEENFPPVDEDLLITSHEASITTGDGTSAITQRVWGTSLCRLENYSHKHVPPDHWYCRVGDKSSETSQKDCKYGASGQQQERSVSGFSAMVFSRHTSERIQTDRSGPVNQWEEYVKVLASPKWCALYKWEGSCAGVSKVTAWLKNTDDESDDVLLVYDTQTEKVLNYRLSTDSVVMMSSAATCPCLVLTSKVLKAVAFDVGQEEFINRLMLYDSATVADSLCHLNNWERCSIPIHALEVGLKHRQLDTVAFFLKSREHVFTSQTNVELSTDLSVPVCEVVGDFEQLQPAIQLLLSTIRENLAESQSKQFGEQLLHITLDYLYKVLKDALEALQGTKSSCSFGQHCDSLEDTVQQLMDYTVELRQHMKGVRMSRRTGQFGSRASLGGEQVGGLYSISEEHRQILHKWDTMPTQHAIVHGIVHSQVPLLQSYLRQREGSEQASFQQIVNVGLQQALQNLCDHHTRLASQIFANMGFDVSQKLRQVCFYTPDKSLRDFLVDFLKQENLLTEEEVGMVKFLHQLEALYSCPSFEVAKVLRTEGQPSSVWEETLDLKTLLGYPTHDLVSSCGEIAPKDITNSETSSYANVLLEWIKSWNSETRHRILLEKMLLRKDVSHVESVPAEVLWNYLLNMLDVQRLTEWIQQAYPDKQAMEPTAAMWPYNQPISTAMIKGLDSCTHWLRNALLDLLARCGLFSSDELDDFPLLLQRLGRVHMLFTPPNVLEQRPSSHSICLLDLHCNMIRYCIQQRVPHLLYFYLDYWSLCATSGDLSDLGMYESLPAWVDMMLHFRQATNTLLDPDTVFQASLSACRFVQNMNNVSIATMLDEGLVYQAMATLMYAPWSLEQLQRGTVTDTHLGNLQPVNLQKALEKYPRLYHAVFPRQDRVGDSDISVYKLLQGNAPFDPSRLFGWQTTNHLATDGTSELPHFSHPDLVSRSAHIETLEYSHYLKQGRPSFAFATFLIAQLHSGVTILTYKRLQFISRHVHLLALRRISQLSVAAACVAFLEMLSQDTFLMRLQLQVALLILQYKNSDVMGNVDKRKEAESRHEKETAQLLQSCLLRKRRYSPRVLTQLEEAIQWSIDNDGVTRSSFEAGQRWQLALLWCKYYGLRMSTIFLTECAKADDWLAFLTYAQLHQYPKEQLQEILSLFPSSHLWEHLHYVIDKAPLEPISGAKRAQEHSPSKGRDVRAVLYSRIGLHKIKDIGASSSSADEEETSGSEVAKSPTSDSSSLVSQDTTDTFSLPKDIVGEDIFGVLFACQANPTPWRCLAGYAVIISNPVLSVLAACYENHDLLTCLCTWLVASLPEGALAPILDGIGKPEGHIWSLQELHKLVLAAVQWDHTHTVFTAYRIFQPNSPLQHFLHFCTVFMRGCVKDDCKPHLENFKTAMKQFRSKSSSGDTVPEETRVLGDVQWLESLMSSIVRHMLLSSTSVYDIGNLLQLLDHTNVTRLFMSDEICFSKLYQLHQFSQEGEVTLDFRAIMSADLQVYEGECQRVLGLLQQRSFHNAARIFAEIAGVPSHKTTIMQLKAELEDLKCSNVWTSAVARCTFWKRCNDMMSRHRVEPFMAAQFFQSLAEECQVSYEKGMMYKLIYDWLSKDSKADHQLLMDKFYINIWKSKIRALIEKQQGISHFDNVPGVFEDIGQRQKDMQPAASSRLSELIHCTQTPPMEEVEPKVLLEPQETIALDHLIGELLDCGQIAEACRLASEFGHFNQDLAVVVTCMQLAEGTITPEGVNMKMRYLMSVPSPKMKRSLNVSVPFMPRIVSSSNFSNISRMAEEAASETDDVLMVLELLSIHARQGSQCCKRVIAAYKIAQILGRSYNEVVQEAPFDLLQSVLTCQDPQRFMLARSYINTSCLSNTEVAGFLADTILKSLQMQTGKWEQEKPGSVQQTDSHPAQDRLQGNYAELMQLSPDSSSLGQRLLDAATSLATSNTEVSHRSLSVEVELLVYAHDCYTMSCNMEGIAQVLRAARRCTSALAQAEQYMLMIRLLTGMGRFSEMTYIFDTLKQQHQFELLFRKGIDREDKLRLAIVDYLKRYHPTDSDTYTMVSLHFTMFREIAQMLEEAARKHLNMLKGKPLDNNQDTQLALKNIMQYFSDAAESYVKENCLRHAEACVKQARLVALQLHMLSQGTHIINLNKETAAAFIIKHPKFYEAYIVCEAYSRHSEWPAAVCQHVVFNGDFKYLHDMKAHIPITPGLISDVANRYKYDIERPKQAASNMKRLLLYIKDLQVTYKLANDLGFTDLTQDLLKGDAGVYLRDIIAS